VYSRLTGDFFTKKQKGKFFGIRSNPSGIEKLGENLVKTI
jgi:hypothetical protein